MVLSDFVGSLSISSVIDSHLGANSLYSLNSLFALLDKTINKALNSNLSLSRFRASRPSDELESLRLKLNAPIANCDLSANMNDFFDFVDNVIFWIARELPAGEQEARLSRCNEAPRAITDTVRFYSSSLEAVAGEYLKLCPSAGETSSPYIQARQKVLAFLAESWQP